MRFCPSCGGALELRVPPGEDRDRHVCGACGTVHYQNPKVIVGSVCTLRDRLLLCRRAIEPRSGYWTIPAGFLELGETGAGGGARGGWGEGRAKVAIGGVVPADSGPRVPQGQLLYPAG